MPEKDAIGADKNILTNQRYWALGRRIRCQ